MISSTDNKHFRSWENDAFSDLKRSWNSFLHRSPAMTKALSSESGEVPLNTPKPWIAIFCPDKPMHGSSQISTLKPRSFILQKSTFSSGGTIAFDSKMFCFWSMFCWSWRKLVDVFLGRWEKKCEMKREKFCICSFFLFCYQVRNAQQVNENSFSHRVKIESPTAYQFDWSLLTQTSLYDWKCQFYADKIIYRHKYPLLTVLGCHQPTSEFDLPTHSVEHFYKMVF